MVLSTAPPRRTPTSIFLARCRALRLTRLARIMTGEYEGVGSPVKRVILAPEWKACTDGATVWVPEHIIPDDKAANLIAQEGILAHEAAGHLRYTDFAPWHKLQGTVKSGKDDHLIHTFVNIIEDARINHLLAQDFPGSGKKLAFVEAWAMQQHKEAFAKNGVPEGTEAKAAIVALMTEIIAKSPHFVDNDEVRAFMDEARPLFKACVSQADTKGVIRQARRLITVYREHFPEGGEDFDPFKDGEGYMVDDMSPEQIEVMAEHQKHCGPLGDGVSPVRFDDMKLPEESDGSATGEDGDGEGSGDPSKGGADDGDCDGEGDGKSSTGDTPPTDYDKTPFDPDNIENRDETIHTEEDFYDSDAEQPTAGETDAYGEVGNGNPYADLEGGGIDFDVEDLLAQAATILEEEDYEAIDAEADFDDDMSAAEGWADDASDFGAGRDDSGHVIKCVPLSPELVQVETGAEHYDNIKTKYNSDIRRLANEMARLIKGADTRYSTHHKRGKLDTGRLWAGLTSERIFRQATEKQNPEANIIILIDASGSMGGSRSRYAADAAVVFAEVFDNIRGVNFEIVDFNSQYGGTCGKTLIRVRKAVNAPINQITKANIATPFSGSENSDGNALDWCVNRVRRSFGAGANLVFVISDGQPAGPSPKGYTPASYLQKIVRNLPTDVEVFSVGIAGMDTSAYYGNAVRISDTSQLAREAMPAIRKMLRRML